MALNQESGQHRTRQVQRQKCQPNPACVPKSIARMQGHNSRQRSDYDVNQRRREQQKPEPPREPPALISVFVHAAMIAARAREVLIEKHPGRNGSVNQERFHL